MKRLQGMRIDRIVVKPSGRMWMESKGVAFFEITDVISASISFFTLRISSLTAFFTSAFASFFISFLRYMACNVFIKTV
jgi:Sec7-like guanine-nucleotide exchange factor